MAKEKDISVKENPCWIAIVKINFFLTGNHKKLVIICLIKSLAQIVKPVKTDAK